MDSINIKIQAKPGGIKGRNKKSTFIVEECSFFSVIEKWVKEWAYYMYYRS